MATCRCFTGALAFVRVFIPNLWAKSHCSSSFYWINRLTHLIEVITNFFQWNSIEIRFYAETLGIINTLNSVLICSGNHGQSTSGRPKTRRAERNPEPGCSHAGHKPEAYDSSGKYWEWAVCQAQNAKELKLVLTARLHGGSE